MVNYAFNHINGLPMFDGQVPPRPLLNIGGVVHDQDGNECNNPNPLTGDPRAADDTGDCSATHGRKDSSSS